MPSPWLEQVEKWIYSIVKMYFTNSQVTVLAKLVPL